MKNAREIQALCYLIGGGLLVWVIVGRMLLVVWGVPLHPLLFVALLSALAVIVGGILTLQRPQRGRVIAICGLLGMLSIWFPWIISLVPQHNIIQRPLAYLIVVGYLALFAFAVLFPTRSWFGIAALIAVCASGAVTAGATYRQRQQMGEYARPSIACFRWSPSPTNQLEIARDPFGCVDAKVKDALFHARIYGSLSWTSGRSEGANRILVLAQSNPQATSRLFYPRHGLLVYAYDGKAWTKIPADAAIYPLYSSFEPSGADSMICSEDFDGGR